MKLRYSPTSPFARKVCITIHELGLTDQVELVVTDPWVDAVLRGDNPLGKVPALVLEDGTRRSRPSGSGWPILPSVLRTERPARPRKGRWR